MENRTGEYEVQTSTFNANFKYTIVNIGSDNVLTLKNVKTHTLFNQFILTKSEQLIYIYLLLALLVILHKVVALMTLSQFLIITVLS